jgi:hypothetical protein
MVVRMSASRPTDILSDHNYVFSAEFGGSLRVRMSIESTENSKLFVVLIAVNPQMNCML